MSWLQVSADSHFSIANIPFGVISTQDNPVPRPAVAIEDYCLDLQAFTALGGLGKLPCFIKHAWVLSETSLNAFAALGRPLHRQLRNYLQRVFAADTEFPELLRDNDEARDAALLRLDLVVMHLPVAIRNYTDFYVGRNHAVNCGVLFRGPSEALHPNYTHLPVAYHGRASSVVVSGAEIVRPHGQTLDRTISSQPEPIFGPSRCLDFELELGAIVCKENQMGSPIPISEAEEHLFGLVLLNDWSARDIQTWEMVPLGPFNGKNFATSISPWVILMDALEPFRCKSLAERTPLPYLREPKEENVFDLHLEVELATASGDHACITKTNGKNLLFSFPQMLAHHCAGGCPMQVGDLLGSGTVSGVEPGSEGSLFEQTKAGKLQLSIGQEKRTYIQDGDTITLKGWTGSREHGLIGFGSCAGRITPAISWADRKPTGTLQMEGKTLSS